MKAFLWIKFPLFIVMCTSLSRSDAKWRLRLRSLTYKCIHRRKICIHSRGKASLWKSSLPSTSCRVRWVGRERERAGGSVPRLAILTKIEFTFFLFLFCVCRTSLSSFRLSHLSKFNLNVLGTQQCRRQGHGRLLTIQNVEQIKMIAWHVPVNCCHSDDYAELFCKHH